MRQGSGVLRKFRRSSLLTVHFVLACTLQLVAGPAWAEELHRVEQLRREQGVPAPLSKAVASLPDPQDVYGWLESGGATIESTLGSASRQLVTWGSEADTALGEATESFVELAQAWSGDLSTSETGGPSSVFGALEPRQTLSAPPAIPASLAVDFGTPPWHLLSVPDDPDNIDPAVLLPTVAGDFTLAYAYGACDPVSPWRVYDPNDLEANDLTAVDHRIGFWLKATDPTPLAVSGTEPAETSIQLCAGWNLIGYPLAQDRPVLAALSSILGKFLRVYGFDPNDEVEPWKVYDVEVPDWVNTLRVMERGKGYWIYAVEDTTLVMRNVGPPPEVEITSPQDGGVVTFLTDVVGSVRSDLLKSWDLAYRSKGEDTWTTFASGDTPVIEDVLGVFDPTLLLNGLYEIRLEATDFSGQSASVAINVSVEGKTKVGNFTLSFIDLEVPVVGIPIQVTRTYESRDKRVGDFGVGWTLGLSNVRLQESGPPGLDWEGHTLGAGFHTYCVIATAAHVVTITFPDDEVLKFKPTAVPECHPLIPPQVVDIRYEPLPGTFGTLRPLDQSDRALVVGGFPATPTNSPINPSEPRRIELWDQLTTQIHDPELYELTTQDGRVMVIDQERGLVSVTDLNGNKLIVSSDEITHSSGRALDFVRDGEGRIERIVDPLGQENTYVYNAEGDLVAMTDRSGATTTFSYIENHHLEDIVNALGVRVMRTEYDSEGRMIGLVDGAGKSVQLDHDLDARREVVTDRRGFTRVLEYDARGNVVVEIDELGKTVHRTWDAADNLLTETDALDRTTTFTYNALGSLESVTDALGNRTRLLSPDAFGQPRIFEDALGNTLNIGYNSRAQLETATDVLDQVTTFAYTSRGDLRRIEDPLGNAFQFEYDAFGNLIRETDPLGRVTTMTYDGKGNALTESRERTLSDGSRETLVWTLGYDTVGRPISVTYPDGSTATTEYDALGRSLKRTDEMGRVTSYEYDVLGQLIRMTFADSTTQTWSYDAEGHLVAETDRGGRTTFYEYDPVGRLTSTIHPDGGVVIQTYDDAGRRTSRTDERGQTTTFRYDAAGRLVARTDPLGQETTFTYDANGELLSMTEPGGKTTSYIYDALGRQIRTTFAEGGTLEVAYDALGRRTSVTDQDSKVTHFGYDGLGRLVSVIDALDKEITFAFDEVGNLIRQTDALGRATLFQNDSLGRRIARILPGGERESMTYNTDGTLASRTDFIGRTTTFAYDALGRLFTRTLPNASTVSFTYTATGQVQSAADASGLTFYEYDAMDRLSRKTDPSGRRLDYTYDLGGNRTGLTATVGTQALSTTFGYDAPGHLVSVVDSTGDAYTLSYDNRDNPVRIDYPNGVVTTTVYDALDRIESLTTRDARGTVLESHAYTLSPGGRRQQVEEHDGTVRSYTYDDLHRLVGEEVVDGSGATTYKSDLTYDAVGNRMAATIEREGLVENTSFTYDARDRQVGGGFSWDANGNLQADGESAYSWDLQDRLRQVTQADGTEIFLGYDAEGNLIRTEIVPPGETGVVRHHLVDDSGLLSQAVADIDASGQIETFYLRGDHLLGLERPGAAEKRYFHTDALGSVRLLSDPAEQVTDRYDYSAFGELLAQTGSDDNAYRFAGEATVGDSDLYNLRARWMSPSMGRFLSVDPFSGLHHQPMSLHRYLYANLDPVNLKDPLGLFSVVEISVLNAVRSIITNIQLDVGMAILTQPPLDPDGDLSKIFILLSLAAGGAGLFRAVKGIAVGTFKAARGLFRVGTNSLRDFIDSFKRILRTSPRLRTFCFPAGTGVHTPEGLKPIEEIKAGDTVLAYDLESGEVVERGVEGTSVSWAPRLVDIQLSGEQLSATGSHPFWVEESRTWVPAEDLAVGMKVRTHDGTIDTVLSVNEREAGVAVFNLEVAEEHNYFVGEQGILVHNGTEDPDLADYNQAINEALDWLKERGFKAEEPVNAKLRSDPMVGEPIGMKTAKGNIGFRVEFEPDIPGKKGIGAHINVFAGKEKGPHFKFPGNQNHVNNIRKKFKCR